MLNISRKFQVDNVYDLAIIEKVYNNGHNFMPGRTIPFPLQNLLNPTQPLLQA